MTRTPRQRLRLASLRAFARITPAPTLESAQLSVPMRILVVRPDHMGDLLFITPALRALRERYPKAHITVLAGPWGAPVLSGNPHVDESIILPFPGFSKQRKPAPWRPYLSLRYWARRLRYQYHIAFILRFDHWWGALLTYVARIPRRVGYDVPEVAPFLSDALPYATGRHEVEQNFRLVDINAASTNQANSRHHTITPTHHPLEFNVTEQALAWARDALGETHPIAIHPGAGAAIKLWRADGWAEVADTLARETSRRILLTGSEAERPLCQEIAEKMETEARVLAGKTTLEQLAAVLAECRLVLGLDSGPLHLAVAMGTPTVHLYGPVDKMAFGPWGAPARHRVLVSDWPCVPCNRLDYRPYELLHHPCVEEIKVDRVLTAAHQALVA